MPARERRFDGSAPLRAWVDDPTKSTTDNMLSMIESYSTAFRLLVIEVRALEMENKLLWERVEAISDGDTLGELQKIIDESIRSLDPKG